MKDEKLEAKTWQMALVSAVILFLVYILTNSRCFAEMMEEEIPNHLYRTIAMGLLLALTVFIVVGVMHHYVCPVKERKHQECNPSPFAVIDR